MFFANISEIKQDNWWEIGTAVDFTKYKSDK